jgi:hypothetical protein
MCCLILNRCIPTNEQQTLHILTVSLRSYQFSNVRNGHIVGNITLVAEFIMAILEDGVSETRCSRCCDVFDSKVFKIIISIDHCLCCGITAPSRIWYLGNASISSSWTFPWISGDTRLLVRSSTFRVLSPRIKVDRFRFQLYIYDRFVIHSSYQKLQKKKKIPFNYKNNHSFDKYLFPIVFHVMFRRFLVALHPDAMVPKIVGISAIICHSLTQILGSWCVCSYFLWTIGDSCKRRIWQCIHWAWS